MGRAQSSKSKPKKGKRQSCEKSEFIVQSLKANQKKQTSKELHSETDTPRKSARLSASEKDAAPSTFNCDICSANIEDGKKAPKYKRFEVEIIEDNSKDKFILKFKDELEVNVLCKKHYQSLIRSWISKQKKCCDIFSVHQRPKTTRTKRVSKETAIEAKSYTDFHLIPDQIICTECDNRLKVRY